MSTLLTLTLNINADGIVTNWDTIKTQLEPYTTGENENYRLQGQYGATLTLSLWSQGQSAYYYDTQESEFLRGIVDWRFKVSANTMVFLTMENGGTANLHLEQECTATLVIESLPYNVLIRDRTIWNSRRSAYLTEKTSTKYREILQPYLTDNTYDSGSYSTEPKIYMIYNGDSARCPFHFTLNTIGQTILQSMSSRAEMFVDEDGGSQFEYFGDRQTEIVLAIDDNYKVIETEISYSPRVIQNITKTNSYEIGSNATLEATLYSGGAFDGWYENDTLVSTDNPYTFEVDDNAKLTAKGKYQYSVDFIYDTEYFSSASYSRVSRQFNNLNLTATLNDNNLIFKGWYANNILISNNLSATYTLVEDTILECRAEPIYDITTSVVGNGQIDYSRQSSNPNIVDITSIPDYRNYLLRYEVNGVDYQDNPLTITLIQNTHVVARFEPDPMNRLEVSSNVKNTSIYVSNNEPSYEEYDVTLWARPFPNYYFVKWTDGNTDNPRTLHVDKPMSIEAIYQKELDSNGIYQYRCFVKDQMHLTDKPKAFMVIDTFDLKVDKLTKSTSTFSVYEMPSNINDGDILVVYDPKGQFLYNGVINSIEELTIRTSNMESFYKGKWIYNTHPSTYLEDEIAYLLNEYAQGKIYQSSWTDPQVAQRLGGITIRTTGDNFSPSISVKLPTDLDKDGNENLTQKDMEQFIYELYEKYNIIFDFTINFEGANYVDIKVPNYTKIKVGNNMYGVQNMSPVTTIEETNRLIIFARDKTYRSTYVATSNNIVKEPVSTANRFNITNTKIVFSDDDEADLVANNLPSIMYNHKLTFDLIIKNFVYQFGDFNLGAELDIYNGDDYYDSVLTGYEIKKGSNQNITSVKFVCGKIRNKLTQMLTLNKV